MPSPVNLYPALHETVASLATTFNSISPERKIILSQLSSFISDKASSGNRADIIFICTHNSRRSHIAQLWAQTAAAYYGIPDIACYSGGTEETAFNERAVKAMESVGFYIERTSDSSNPAYKVFFSAQFPPVITYSKKYNTPQNPRNGFAAVMTCSHADENCPVVTGMEKRISLPYDDPKDFDGTAVEHDKYLERVMEIGREILYAFSCVKAGGATNT